MTDENSGGGPGQTPTPDDLRRLSPHDFERLVADLVEADNPGSSTRREQQLGRRRADIVRQDSDGAVAVYEVKATRHPVTAALLTQAYRQVLSLVPDVEALRSITLVFSSDLTAAARRRLAELSHDPPQPVRGGALHAIGASELRAWIQRHPTIREKYFPPPEQPPQGALRRLLVGLAGPRWVPRPPGIVRFAFGVAVVVVLIAVRVPLSPRAAETVGAVGLSVFGLAAASALISWTSFGQLIAWLWDPIVEIELSFPDRTTVRRKFQLNAVISLRWTVTLVVVLLVLRILREVAVSVALSFVAFWTFVYLLLWGLNPTTCVAGAPACAGAFAGATAHPSLGDFVYLAVNGAFFNQPGDLFAVSRPAHAAIAAEFLVAALVIASFAVRFGFGTRAWWRAADPEAE